MSKISGLPELTEPAVDDDVEIRDVSDTSTAATGKNKRITWLTMIAKMFGSRFGADAGANDTYVVTLTPAPAAYVTGEHYRFKANTANTGACTVNFNSLGAKTIKKAAGGITTDLADNDIRAGQWVDLVYDGTNMQMQSLLGNAPAGGSGGIGDVVGPASATDLAIARYDSTTGKLLQDSAVTVDDNGGITVPEIAAPGTPAAGKVAVYAKADGKLYIKDDAGTETDLTATGAGGAEAGANSDITSMDGLTGALETPTRIRLAEVAAPSTPPAGTVELYVKSDGKAYIKDDAGTETDLTGAGGGAVNPTSLLVPYNNAGTFADSRIKRENTNITALNGGNATPQTLKIYFSDDGAGNTRYLQFADASGIWEMLSTGAGSGGTQNIRLRVGTNGVDLASDALRPVTDRSHNLGGGTTQRWNQLFIFRIDLNGDGLFFTSGPSLKSHGTGWLGVKDESGSGNLTRISLGDPGTSGVALTKPASQTYMEARLGDNSAYTGFRAKYLRVEPVTFANLPASPVEGMTATVTDSSTATWGATIAGGGANRVLAYYNGTNWTVAGV